MKMPVLFLFLVLISLTGICQDSTSTYDIIFRGYSTKLSKDHRTTLDSIVSYLKKQPALSCAIANNCTFCRYQKKSIADWDRLNKMASYIFKNGIESNRVIMQYGNFCAKEGFTISFTTERFSTVPAPHPNLRRKQASTNP